MLWTRVPCIFEGLTRVSMANPNKSPTHGMKSNLYARNSNLRVPHSVPHYVWDIPERFGTVLLSASQLINIVYIAGRTLSYGKTRAFRDKESHAIRS